MGEAMTAYSYYETARVMQKRIPRKSISDDNNVTKIWGFVAREFQKENVIDPYNRTTRRLEQRSRQSVRVITHVTGLDDNLAGKFESLATQWRNETKFLSSITDKAVHPCYQRIIGLGPAAITIILLELRKRGGHWFWALESITGENPVLPAHYGDIKNMTHDWIEWGKNKGYLI